MPDRKKMPVHTKVFLGLLIGAVAGTAAQAVLGHDDPGLKAFVKDVATPVGMIFMRAIFMIVIPLLFSALVLGVAEIGAAKSLGRVGVRSLLLTVLLSGIAVGLALLAVNVVKPGEGITPERRVELIERFGDEEGATKRVAQAAEREGLGGTLLGIIPRNPFEEAAKPDLGGVLPLMVFALVFGVALANIEPEKAEPLKAFLQGVFAVSQKIIDYAMLLAPLGVGALIFGSVATLGIDGLLALGKYAGLVLSVLAIHLFVTYPLALRILAKRNPVDWFRRVRGVMLTAFATASSNATLPTALRSAEEDLGLPRKISSFVLTVGATANQNGTALFEGITVLFLAQVFGMPLSIGEQLTVIGMCILAGIGTAGVPGGAWPMIAAICGMVGVPPSAIALCMGIDRPLDMSRTVLNVTGDMTIATCVAAMEPRPATASAP